MLGNKDRKSGLAFASILKRGVPRGIRTPVIAVKGGVLGRLNDGAFKEEPITATLTCPDDAIPSY
jgi:hypothetical protein